MAKGSKVGKSGWFLIAMMPVLLIGTGLVNISCGGGDPRSNRPHDIFMSADVTTEDDLLELLPQYEALGIQFERREEGRFTGYVHERTLDGVKVEKDHIAYLFDKNTKRLVDKMIRWRSDLPEHLPPLAVTKEQAESMVEGKVRSPDLYYIDPETHRFPIEPTPENPCWVVTSIVNGNTRTTIIDAVTGELLGYIVPPPPPYTAFSLSGPEYLSPWCGGAWTGFYENAEDWFNTMGYSTEAVARPTEDKVKSHIQSTETAMFYEIAHGGSTYFSSGCAPGPSYENTTASEIENWIEDYTKMPFTFLASCNAMCDTGNNTLSYELRKGSEENTATVGYCGMGEDECDNCWEKRHALDWQDNLFYLMSLGYTVKDAFDAANIFYPQCSECVAFAGDESFKVVPVVVRCSPGDDIGFWRDVNGQGYYFFDMNDNGLWDAVPTDAYSGPFGTNTDTPIIGDWDGDGDDDIGFWRDVSGQGYYFFDMNDNGLWDAVPTDAYSGPFGTNTDTPIIGDWDGDGDDDIGFWRDVNGQGYYFFDMNDNGLWDAVPTDAYSGPFGTNTDTPIIGDWDGQ